MQLVSTWVACSSRPGSPGLGRERSGDAEDLGDEDQGRPALDAGLRDAVVAVAEFGGDGQQDPGADALTRETVVPAADDLTDADAEGQRLAPVVGVIEDRSVPGLSELVGRDGVACLDLRPASGVEELHLKAVGGIGSGEGEGRFGSLGALHRGHGGLAHDPEPSDTRGPAVTRR